MHSDLSYVRTNFKQSIMIFKKQIFSVVGGCAPRSLHLESLQKILPTPLTSAGIDGCPFLLP